MEGFQQAIAGGCGPSQDQHNALSVVDIDPSRSGQKTVMRSWDKMGSQPNKVGSYYLKPGSIRALGIIIVSIEEARWGKRKKGIDSLAARGKAERRNGMGSNTSYRMGVCHTSTWS